MTNERGGALIGHLVIGHLVIHCRTLPYFASVISRTVLPSAAISMARLLDVTSVLPFLSRKESQGVFSSNDQTTFPSRSYCCTRFLPKLATSQWPLASTCTLLARPSIFRSRTDCP